MGVRVDESKRTAIPFHYYLTIFITVKGKENITAYCKQLLKEADKYVLISMWNQMYELLLPELEECKNRGCSVLGISHDIDNPMEGIEKHFNQV